MTTKQQHLLLSLLALLLIGFSSCVNEDIIPVAPDSGDNRTVSIRLDQNSATRGISDAIPNNTAVAFNRGDLYLLTSGGTIVRHFDIHNITAQGTDVDAGYIYVEDLHTGVHLNEVPGTVARVVIVGNTTGNPTSGTLQNVSARSINIVTQHNARTPGVNLWGSETLERCPNTAQPQANGRFLYRVQGGSIELYPTVARIELREFRATGTIASFTIDGIFIDRHYYNAHVGGFIPGTGITPHANFISRGQNSTLFQAGQQGYNDANNALHDIVNTPATGTPLSVARPGNSRWAYQLFADRLADNATGTRKPSIVIRMSNVTLTCGHIYTVPQYITIGGFINAATDTRLTGIHARHVYSIDVVQFSERNLSIYPNEREIDVNTRITLATWNENQVVHDGFRTPSPLSRALGCLESHTFYVDAAVNGSCTTGRTVTYRWEQSTDGGITWVDAVASADAVAGVNDRLSQNFTTAPVTQNTHFRRIAYCACGVASIASFPALLSVPPRAPASNFPLYVRIGDTYWATRNVCFTTINCLHTHPDYRGFAYHPADAGMLFQWNNNTGWSNWHPAVGGFPTHRWCLTANDWIPAQDSEWGSLTGLIWNGLMPANKPHQGPCPQGWRLPTTQEFLDLVNASPDLMGAGANQDAVFNFGWVNRGEWVEALPFGDFACQAGVLYGTAATVFFPAAGMRSANGTFIDMNMRGVYWSSEVNDVTFASGAQFFDGLGSSVNSGGVRNDAFSVRCVKDDGSLPPPPTLSINPQSLDFNAIPTDAQNVTVTTNQSSWTTTIVYNSGGTGWLSVTASGIPATPISVIPNSANVTESARTATVTVNAGTATSVTFTVTQGFIPAVCPTSPLTNPYVGAFWRAAERGERIIRFANVTGSNIGAWTASVAWLEPGRWNEGDIVLEATALSTLTARGIYSANPGNAENFLVPGSATTVSGSVASGGDIIFRIGLNSTIAAGSAPRYAVVLLTYGNNVSTHKLFLRQGEASDFAPGQSSGARWSPFNLNTATGGTVEFPTQAGATFRWTNTTPAYAPFPTGIVANWGTLSMTGTPPPDTVCPPSYRLPTGGDDNSDAAVFRSAARVTFGFYADGFFDRRQIVQSPINPGLTSVAVSTDNNLMAFRGSLVFGGSNNASIFLPVSGNRDTQNGTFHNLGEFGSWWTSSPRGTTEAYRLSAGPGGVAREGFDRRGGLSIRCVRD